MAKDTVNPKGKPIKKPVESDEDSSEEEPVVVKKQKVDDTKSKTVAAAKKKPVESSDESEPEFVAAPTGKGKVAQKVEAKAKVAAKKVQDSDESSEEEKPAPKKAAAPAAKKVTKPASSDESDDEPAPPKKVAGKPAPTKAAPKKPASDESSSEEEVKPATKKPVAKPAAKKMDVESSSEEEAPKAKTTTTKPVAKKQADSEEDDEEEEKVAPKKAGGAPAGGQKGAYECYVGNLPFNASENDLKEFFASCGEVDSVNLLKGPDGRSKGIAFVRFNDESAQTAAVEFNGEDYNGRAIKVEKSIPKEQRAPRDNNGGFGGKPAGGFTKNTERDPNSTTVFVGNLGYRTSEDAVASFFGDCGEVKAVRIAYDQDGRSRGFAHVEFTTTDAIDSAMAKAGQELDGRGIRVDFSGNKRDNNGGGGRGGFGGGSRGGFGGGRGGRGGFGGGRGGNEFASQNKGSISSFQGQRTKL